MELNAQEGKKGSTTEGTVGVQVGVIGRPARHDLLIVHQAFTGAALRAAGHQHLAEERFLTVRSPPVVRHERKGLA